MHRYVESAKVEADVLERVNKADNDGISRCIRQYEHFAFSHHNKEYYAIIFEELGKSLFDIIKSNNYRGNCIYIITIQRISNEIHTIFCNAIV